VKGAFTSWRRERDGWETRGCAEWRTSPAAMGRVAKIPRPADSVKATRIGGGPWAAAAAVERRRRRRRDMSSAETRAQPLIWLHLSFFFFGMYSSKESRNPDLHGGLFF
jgi:hypothetical protein